MGQAWGRGIWSRESSARGEADPSQAPRKASSLGASGGVCPPKYSRSGPYDQREAIVRLRAGGDVAPASQQGRAGLCCGAGVCHWGVEVRGGAEVRAWGLSTVEGGLHVAVRRTVCPGLQLCG